MTRRHLCSGEDEFRSPRWRSIGGGVGSAKVRYRSPEQLRHTVASTLRSRNAPLLYVQGQGGWRSASVLLRVYARWMPEAFLEGAQVRPAATQAQPQAPEVQASRGSSAR